MLNDLSSSHNKTPTTIDTDSLWQIFDIIAYENTSQSSIDTLRAASQVCIEWRRLLLSSTLIWAKLINLGIFKRKTKRWINEVLRRTGDSALYVQCTDARLSPTWESYLQTLLQENWYRIKLLNIHVHHKFLTEDGPISQLLRLPAPLLETFNLVWVYSPSSSYARERLMTNMQLRVDFGKQAPLLRSFTGTLLHIPSNAKWLSNLEHLSFRPDYGLLRLLHVLPSLPHLRHLFLQSVEQDVILKEDLSGIEPDIPIILPRLLSIGVLIAAERCYRWTNYLTLLENIQTGSGYALTFTVNCIETFPDPVDMERLGVIITNCFTSLKDDAVELIIKTTGYGLNVKTPGLHVDLQFQSFDYEPYVTTLLKALSMYSFRWINITKFTLNINVRKPPYNDLALAMLLSCLTSVKKLTIHSSETLAYISQCPLPRSSKLFPALESIQMDSIGKSTFSYLHTFLQNRVNLGKPIESISVNTIINTDMESLERFEGLRIVWGDQERKTYICGSGNSAILKSLHSAVSS